MAVPKPVVDSPYHDGDALCFSENPAIYPSRKRRASRPVGSACIRHQRDSATTWPRGATARVLKSDAEADRAKRLLCAVGRPLHSRWAAPREPGPDEILEASSRAQAEG